MHRCAAAAGTEYSPLRDLPARHETENLSVLHNPYEFPIQALRDLKQDWDSYGAKPIDESVIQRAYELWRQLAGFWSVVPMSDGGIQIEQHCDGFDIEIVVARCSERR